MCDASGDSMRGGDTIFRFAELCRRYHHALVTSWKVRRQLDVPARPSYESQFLPAHLEIVETPTHPAPRWAARVIVALALCVVVIMFIGRLDIVVVAKGKLIPSDRVKIIQPALTGVVQRIYVRDGQRVSVDQPLLVLDTTQAAAEADKARSGRVDAALALARARAVLHAQETGDGPRVERVSGAESRQMDETQEFAEGIYREFVDKLAGAQAELRRKQAELETTNSEIAKLRATTPLARKEADDYRELAKDKYVPVHDYMNKEQIALEHEHDLRSKINRSIELRESVAEQKTILNSTVSQFRREQLDVVNKSTQQFSQFSSDETKAEARKSLLTLKAPVEGTVQQLAVYTLGGVVTTAQSVMEIVPDDSVEVEVNIENKDIGFVSEGQDVIVKVEAFPFARYGYINGKVIRVSNDAVSDKLRRGALHFVARIRLSSGRIKVDEKWIPLTPGMEVVGEIRTGRRTVADYFFEPMIGALSESLHER